MSVAPQDSAYDGETVAKQAKEWIDRVNAAAGPSGGWRLQVIRFRTRRKFRDDPGHEPDESVLDVNGDPVASLRGGSSDDPCDELPVRIRRFVPGCPWALVDQAVRYLHRIAPYTGIIYNGVKLEGSYRPTLTLWQRDEQSLSPAERGSLGTYTLIQDLVEITECPDELLVPSASSCQAYEETKYVWDADSVEPLPVTCEQGVSYSIRAVQRNEDGTYDYQLVKTVSKTSSWGPVTIECTPQAETQEWGWKNLYGEPGSGLYAVPCGSDSRTLVDLPPACDERGVLTQVQVTQNQDCTFDAVVRRRTSKPFQDEWTDGTSCRPETTASYENQLSMPPVPEAAPGETVRVQMRRNPDDTYSGTVSVRAAAEPLDYGWTEGTECRERSVRVLQNQVEMPSVPQLSSLPEGSTLEASLTRSEDCLWDARYTVTEPPEPFEMGWTQGSLCRPDEVSVHQGVAAAPDPSEFLPREPGDIVSGSVQRNADCTYDWRKETRKAAPPIPDADRSWTQGTACRPETVTVYQNEATRPDVPAATGGREVSASLRRNEDCTWDGQVTVREPAAPDHMQWTEGSSCRVVDSHHLVNQATYSIPAPGEGESVSASVSRNQDCTYDYSYKVQKPYEGAAPTWDDGPACQQRHHTLWIDQRTQPTIAPAGSGQTVQASLRFDPSSCSWSGEQVVVDAPSADHMQWTEGSSCRTVDAHHFVNQRSYSIPTPGEGESVSASVSRNADCTYDYSYKVQHRATVDATPSWDDGPSCQRTHHTLFISAPEKPDIPDAEPGGLVRASLNFNENDCTWSGQMAVTPKADDASEDWTEGTECRPSDTHAVWNATSVSIPSPSGLQRVNASVRRNDDCTYSYQYSTTTVEPKTSDWQTWTSTVTHRNEVLTYEHGTLVFEHQDSIPQPPANAGQVEVHNLTLDEFCRYSGSMSYATLVDAEWVDRGGSGGIREQTVEEVVWVGNDATGRPIHATGEYEIWVFLGTGNEGTEADCLKNGWRSCGGHGSVRAYKSPAPKKYIYHVGLPQ